MGGENGSARLLAWRHQLIIISVMSEMRLTDPIAEAARGLLAAQLRIIHAHFEDVARRADVTSVHEMRKAIRRSLTAVTLFAPYFEPETMPAFHPPLRKIMKRLGRARDLAILGQNLDAYLQAQPTNREAHDHLTRLREHIQTRQTAAETQFQTYLQREKWRTFWQDYASFLQTPGAGVLPPPLYAPTQVRHLLPVLIYQRLANVLAFGDHLEQATLAEMHQLRLQAKELRYALEFFAPLLGPTFTVIHATVKRMLAHVGERWLAQELEVVDSPELRRAIQFYQGVLRQRLHQLLAEFPQVWAEFDHPAWRINLALALPP